MLTKFVQAINESNEKVNSVYLLNKDKILDINEWNKDKIQNFHSISKTFASLALGFAINEGMLNLNNTMAELFPSYVNEGNQTALDSVKVSHLASLSIGQSQPLLMMDTRKQLQVNDWAEYIFNQPFDLKAGEHFTYSNVGPYLIVRAIQEQTNGSLIDYLTPRLFAPLDIQEVRWEKDPQGFEFGAGGLYTRPSSVVKVAQLFLNKGKYEGKQLMSSDWIEKMSTPHNTHVEKGDYTDYYGYGMWGDHASKHYRGDGAFGQLMVFLPEYELSIVVASTEADNGVLLDKVFKLIVPELGTKD